jgi:predicted permease
MINSRTVPGHGIVRVLARLVPASHREDWLAEWTAELAHTGLSPWRSRLRALGAVSDALWLRRRHGNLSSLDSTMLAHDVRFAARTLLRRPAFTTIVVATLALCVGASTSVFSIVEAVLMRGLAYRDLDRLVAVWSNNAKEKNDHYQVSVGDYFDWRDRSRSFEQLAGFFPIWNATYTAPDVAERLDVGVVSANFLGTLGVRPQIGRDFTPGEDAKGAAPVAILTHGFWTRSFQQDPAVVGKVVNLDGQPYVVAGVMGSDFTFPPTKVDVIVPLPMLGSYITRREVHMLSVIGRVRPGVTPDAVRREMTPIVAQLEQEHPKENAGLGLTIRPLAEDLLGDVRRPILVLFGAVCAVLLVGCANVANLMLSRATGRRQELAVRAAMGAEPSAIARQLLVESGLIAIVAGVIGIGLAYAATRVLGTLLPASIAKIGTVRVDGTVLAFTSLVCVGVALLCGIAPALRGARGVSREALVDAARGSSRGRGSRRFHNTLVVAELALALVLVVSAGLLINSFSRLVATDAGFRADHLVRMKIALPNAAYTRPQRGQFFESVLQQAAAIPGVQSAALVSRFPLHDGNLTTNVLVEGAAYADGDQLPSVDYRVASPRYFATMGIPVMAGREFDGTESADSGATLVTVINRAAATKLFGTVNAVGKRLRLGGAQTPLFTVVGVVGDIRDASLREPPHPQAYISARQGLPGSGSIVVRYTGVVPGTVVGGVRRIVSSLDKTLPVFDVQTIDEVMRVASRGDRFTMTLLSGFAFLALVLAALGTYGVIAYGVAERTREIGVRMALGARASEVRSMVLREGMALFAIALPFALIGIWWARRALGGLLFNLPVSDPATISAAVLTLALATTAACYVPARRASRVDPTIAMRS